MDYPSVTFVGLGYIGLPTAVVMANHGIRVSGVDTDPRVVSRTNRGEISIVEPGLQEALSRAIHEGQLKATTKMVHSDIFVIAVPTPFTADRHGDLSYIMSAIKSIAPTLRGGELIVLESTSPPGTMRQLSGTYLLSEPIFIWTARRMRQKTNYLLCILPRTYPPRQRARRACNESADYWRSNTDGNRKSSSSLQDILSG